MTTAIALLVAAHVFDYLSFLVMTARHGLAAELNPVVVVLAEQFGLPGLTVAKLASVLFLVIAATALGRHRPRGATVLLTVGIMAGVVGGLSNVAST
jgi:hypothetical protein